MLNFLDPHITVMDEDGEEGETVCLDLRDVHHRRTAAKYIASDDLLNCIIVFGKRSLRGSSD